MMTLTARACCYVNVKKGKSNLYTQTEFMYMNMYTHTHVYTHMNKHPETQRVPYNAMHTSLASGHVITAIKPS